MVEQKTLGLEGAVPSGVQVQVLLRGPFWARGVTAAAMVLETIGEIRGGAIPSAPTNFAPKAK